MLDERFDVLVVDVLLLVGQLLERIVHALETLIVDRIPQLGDALVQSVSPRVLAEHELVGRDTHVARVHDLVSAALLEHAVLMNPRLVSEGIFTDDGLVALHLQTGERRNQPADRIDPPRVDVRGQIVNIAARANGHDNFFQRGVAGPFADAVDRALDLTSAVLHRRQRVRHRQPEIIMAVR